MGVDMEPRCVFDSESGVDNRIRKVKDALVTAIRPPT
jgi:hypothetical protein